MRGIKMLAVLHLVGNALLLWLGYYWLGIGEASVAALLWGALVGLVVLAGACWLHGGTLAWFRAPLEPGVFRKTLARLLPLAVAVLAIGVVYYFVGRLREWSADPGYSLASWLTLKLRKPVKPAAVLRAFDVVFWIVRWAVVPVFVVPLAADLASNGWSGLRAFGRLAGKWLYWIEAPVLLVCAIRAPLALIGWVPPVGGFSMEMASFVARLAAAYLLFTASWLVLEFVTSGGKPVFSQPTTADKP